MAPNGLLEKYPQVFEPIPPKIPPNKLGWQYPISDHRKQKSPVNTGLTGHFGVYVGLGKTNPWRRGWDSNPRYLAVRLISSQVHSATLPPLLCRSR